MTLEPVDTTRCPECAARCAVRTVHEPALVRHGGYGATRTTTTRTCPDCGWHLVHEVTERRPDGETFEA